MASFATDSIIIIHTKSRNYKHWRFSCKNGHAKKVEVEYLAECKVFNIQIALFLPLNSRLRGCLDVGRRGDFDVEISH